MTLHPATGLIYRGSTFPKSCLFASVLLEWDVLGKARAKQEEMKNPRTGSGSRAAAHGGEHEKTLHRQIDFLAVSSDRCYRRGAAFCRAPVQPDSHLLGPDVFWRMPSGARVRHSGAGA